MKKSILSERKLVIVLFILVVILFSFAQAYSNKLEKMFLDGRSPVPPSSHIPTKKEAITKTIAAEYSSTLAQSK